ncbi:MAG: hypothetical protein DWQ49_09745 [Bacteroidetes bacterium]|nr:MAG: hypothetical protein DWQ49_09745 [Bacteroidota bacterium]
MKVVNDYITEKSGKELLLSEIEWFLCYWYADQLQQLSIKELAHMLQGSVGLSLDLAIEEFSYAIEEGPNPELDSFIHEFFND